MIDYKNKKFEEGDIPAVESIFKSAFGVKVDAKKIKSKYFHKYQECKLSYLAVYKDGVGASFYGMIHLKAVYNETVFRIAQSCDSMTHSDHTGKGLFVRLGKEAYANAKEKGIDYIYGFPNDTIYQLRLKKLAWKHLEDINVFRYKVAGFPLAKVAKKFPVFKPLYLFYSKRVFSKNVITDIFPNSVIDQNIAGVLHDRSYFEYKSSQDKFIIELNGVKFWIKLDGFLWVGDFERTGKVQFEKAFKQLADLATRAGCGSIVFHFQEDTHNSDLLKECLGITGTMPLGFIHLTEKYSNYTFKFSGSDFDSW